LPPAIAQLVCEHRQKVIFLPLSSCSSLYSRALSLAVAIRRASSIAKSKSFWSYKRQN